ncbi:dicarbixylic amino acid permease [Mycena capillaripes]|nr:dicarbixylic amino acid permease [Mycena capillaripes]
MDDEKKIQNSDLPPSLASESLYYHGAEELNEPSAENNSLHRGLKARQISMIALGGAVGTGLIIGSGTALTRGGPLGILLGYGFVGFVCYLVMVGLGEMAAYLPHSKGFAGYATRFVDPALGFALGWNYLLKYLIVTPNNINAAGVVVQYWHGGRTVPSEVWMGGNPEHDRIGFRYWKAPNGPMGHYLLSVGTELIGAQNPRRNIPIAIRRTFFRILVFYVGGVFVIGLVVPSTDTTLFTANKSKTGAAASPFVVAATLVSIRTLNHVINGAILVFVMSAANSDLYIGSRTLYGLAIEGKAPKIFSRVNRNGVPYPALILCTAFCSLVFLNVSSSSAKGEFVQFVNLVSTFGAITWMCIAYSHISFMRALKAQGKSRDSLPYKAPFQPYGSWFALISTAIIVLFKGFDTFMPFKSDTFVTCLPVFAILYSGYKFYYRTRNIPADKVDLVTGLQAIDEAEQRFLMEEKAKGPQSFVGRLWDSL